MVLRTASVEGIICPSCGESHGECADWVKSMPHREVCTCGEEMLCWFESETVYFAEGLGKAKESRRKKKKSKKKGDGKKKGKKKKKKKRS